MKTVTDAMFAAGWLTSRDVGAKGEWRLDWTDKGRRRASLLKMVIEHRGLDRNDEAPFTFDTFALSERLGNDSMQAQAGHILGDYWNEAIHELGFAGLSQELQATVRLIVESGPEKPEPRLVCSER